MDILVWCLKSAILFLGTGFALLIGIVLFILCFMIVVFTYREIKKNFTEQRIENAKRKAEAKELSNRLKKAELEELDYETYN